MTVILILGTFLVFILIDFFFHRKTTKPVSTVETPSAAPALLSAASIEGIMVPDQLRYHSGHTWLTNERPELARVGADALVAKTFDHIDRIEIPKPGRWVRQGQKAFTVWCGDQHLDIVSPAEGEITEVNSDLVSQPSLMLQDPYGRGWMVKVNMPDPELVERNLLPRNIVRTWMREEIRQVRAARPMAQVKAVNEN
jgi:glycine cleavage system H protein